MQSDFNSALLSNIMVSAGFVYQRLRTSLSHRYFILKKSFPEAELRLKHTLGSDFPLFALLCSCLKKIK